MSRTRLEELEALCEEATPGPWEPVLGHVRHGQPQIGVWHGTEYRGNLLVPAIVPSTGELRQAKADAQFIAAARSAVPQLITDVREISMEMKRLRRIADHATSGVPSKVNHLLPSAVLAGKPPHRYLSTACDDAGRFSVSVLHGRCRRVCKFCGAKCLCTCHTNEGH